MASITVLALLLPLGALGVDVGLRDNPVVGDQISYLDGPAWKISGSNGVSFLGSVPGDLITDLHNAGQIGDPIFGKNWLNSSIWEGNNWTYSTEMDGVPSGMSRVLVFDGIKMGAVISINGHTLFTANDQFLRYSAALDNIKHELKASGNVLQVTFVSSIDVGGRFMACTGGWDWAPYSNTFQGGKGGPHTLSKGIWKSVYTVDVQDLAITHLNPQVMYNGEYPVQILQDGAHGGFSVTAKVHIWAPQAKSGAFQLSSEWGMSKRAQMSFPAGDSVVELSVNASAEQIRLWWPTGMGEQHMYNLTVGYTGDGTTVSAVRRIGFRYAALVTGNDTDAGYVQRAVHQEGTESHGMFFRVNGAAVWTRGANMIPMEEFEGRMSSQAHTQLVASAVDGGMNMLRVWGGGMFLPDAWYDACDELGVLVYHDMQYAQSGHAPQNNTVQEQELRHQIRRLSAHPSIIVWDGCNECQVKMNTPTGIYASFVMTVVAQEDMSRSIWPSCPALGWTAGVNKLDSLPNGNPLVTPDSGTSIETHGPYQHGSGFPSVNGASKLGPFDPNMPITISAKSTGLTVQNVYASEFGAVVMSSFESMSATLAPEHWGCLLYTSPSPRDRTRSRMPSSA
eukprot:TRINITY_DN19740_c0_g2_i4.p1 TRINITY_DN19740_c0_g2~~TRINITY_DN19740_c0_g2_i4.p1  ORF type:complete len:621 (-),score=140.84 TRINITY_DN19740_c0_g2_i4:49-1911(-)